MKKIKEKVTSLLRWSEKYTRTNMVYLFKGWSWLTITHIIGSMGSLGTSIAFANLLPPETYGQYRYVLSILNLLTIPTLTGMGTSLMKSVAQGFDGSIVQAVKYRFIGGVFGTLIGSCISIYYIMRGNHTLAISILVISIIIPIFYSAELYVSFLRGKKFFKVLTSYSIFSTIIPTITLIVALLLSNNTAILLASYFIPFTLTRVVLLIISYKKYKDNDAQDPGMINYGKHLSVIEILGTIADNLDKLLLWYFLGAKQLAVFTFAMAPVKNFSGAIANIRVLIFPKIAAQEIPYLKKTVWLKTLQLFIFVLVVVTTYILLAPTLFSWVFPQYMDSVKFSQYLALTFLFYPQIFMATVFSAHAKIKEKYITSIFGSIGKIVLLLLLVPHYGIMGIIASYLIMKAASFLVTTVLFLRLR